MQHSPSSEANRSPGIKKITLILQNPKVLPPAVTILNQISLVLALQFHILKIHFNIILSSKSCKVSLSPSRLPHQTPLIKFLATKIVSLVQWQALPAVIM